MRIKTTLIPRNFGPLEFALVDLCATLDLETRQVAQFMEQNPHIPEPKAREIVRSINKDKYQRENPVWQM